MIPISLTCADYARIMPLATGEVRPDGIALTMILGSRGSWPARAEMLRRAVQDPAVHGRPSLRRPAGLSAAQLHGA